MAIRYGMAPFDGMSIVGSLLRKRVRAGVRPEIAARLAGGLD